MKKGDEKGKVELKIILKILKIVIWIALILLVLNMIRWVIVYIYNTISDFYPSYFSIINNNIYIRICICSCIIFFILSH